MGPTRWRVAESTEVAAFVDKSRTVALANAPQPGLVAPSVFYGERRSTSPSNENAVENDSRNQQRNEMYARPSVKTGEDPCSQGEDPFDKGDSKMTDGPSVTTGEDPCKKGDDPFRKGEDEPCNQGEMDPLQKGEEHKYARTNVNIEERKGNGMHSNYGSAARLPPYGMSSVVKWREQKESLSHYTSLDERQKIIYELANTGSLLLKMNQGKLGDVAREIGGTLVSPPLNLNDVERHFGSKMQFPDIPNLIDIVDKGVPAKTHDNAPDLTSSLRYGNHATIDAHMDVVWEKLIDDVQQNRCLVFNKADVESMEGVRVSPLGAVVGKKIRIINDFSFDPKLMRGQKGGVNADTVTEEVPDCLCGDTLPAFLSEITRLRVKWPDKRILVSTADVNNAYRNVRVAPDDACKFCYTIGNLLVADFRLTFGWTGSPGNWGVMASAAEHSHRNTNITNVQLLEEGKRMMSHVKVVKPWEEGPPTQVPREANVKPHEGGGPLENFSCGVYVDDFALAKVQHDPDDNTALVASASLASDCVRLFGPAEKGQTPILAPKKSTDWNTKIDFLGHTIDTHKMTIATTRERIDAIRTTLAAEWPDTRQYASVQEVLSIAGKLWNLTYVMRAGKYFVWHLLRLTGLHDKASRQTRKKRQVRLGWEFHGDLDFWKWALDAKLAEKVLSSSTTCTARRFAAISQMPASTR